VATATDREPRGGSLSRSPVKRLVACCLATVWMVAAPGTSAHGDLFPRHGGIVAWAGELGVEVVLAERTTTVHVEDHGTPFDVRGSAASVTASHPDGSSNHVELTPSGASAFAGGPLRVATGTKLSVVLRLADGQVAMARTFVR